MYLCFTHYVGRTSEQQFFFKLTPNKIEAKCLCNSTNTSLWGWISDLAQDIIMYPGNI